MRYLFILPTRLAASFSRTIRSTAEVLVVYLVNSFNPISAKPATIFITYQEFVKPLLADQTLQILQSIPISARSISRLSKSPWSITADRQSQKHHVPLHSKHGCRSLSYPNVPGKHGPYGPPALTCCFQRTNACGRMPAGRPQSRD